jgi:LacI family transcriptional regulator
MNEKKSTLASVAKLAGVSIKTASRVVRRERNVSEKTRSNVEAAIRKLSYRPSIAARAAVGSRSYLIGLVFDNPNSDYIVDLLRGAIHQAREEGYHLIVEPVRSQHDSMVHDLRRLIIQSNLDGVLLPPPICDSPDVLAVLKEQKTPYVKIASSESFGGGLSVGMDDVSAAATMTGHLADLGHTNIGFVQGREGTSTTSRRLEGFQSAMQERGLAIKPEYIYEGDYTFKAGLLAGEQFFKLASPPSAIFASNDEMAAGLAMAAFRSGRSVPDDVSIAGFDDSPISRMIWPPLTTIRQPIQAISQKAISLLINELRQIGNEDSVVTLHFDLITRGSTARLDPDISY